jgi:NAD(P)-dependent dehydrogenase (short-subunit alcohol dehydrogenase family)
MKKVYLITGAGHFPGIGSCLAEYLLEHDHNVVINSRTFDSEWQEIQSQYSEQLRIVAGDITDPAVQDHMISNAIDSWGRIDVLVNNASSTKNFPLSDREEWNKEFLLNVIVPYELSTRASEYLRLSKGSIIMIGARVALQILRPSDAKNLAYSASKSAMHHLSTSLSVLLGPDIRVNTVAPALFPSARQQVKYTQQQLVDLATRWHDDSLTGEIVSSQGLVDTVIFLANNPNITGQIIPVCNGATVNRI